MQELRLVAVSEDGTYLVLATAGRGTRFTLPVDDRLRAAVRGNFSRLGQYEIEVESPLRPKEIQARIRAGETAEEIAATAGIPVERVRWFEGPVLQEREYMAQQAQRCAVRLPGDSAPGPTLGDLVAERLTRRGVPADEIEWDSAKRDDNLWRIKLGFVWNGHTRNAEWIFDPRRRHITPHDDEAMRLSAGEYVEPAEDSTVTPFVPRVAKLAPVPPLAPEPLNQPPVSFSSVLRHEPPAPSRPVYAQTEPPAQPRPTYAQTEPPAQPRPTYAQTEPPAAYQQPPMPPLPPGYEAPRVSVPPLRAPDPAGYEPGRPQEPVRPAEPVAQASEPVAWATSPEPVARVMPPEPAPVATEPASVTAPAAPEPAPVVPEPIAQEPVRPPEPVRPVDPAPAPVVAARPEPEPVTKSAPEVVEAPEPQPAPPVAAEVKAEPARTEPEPVREQPSAPEAAAPEIVAGPKDPVVDSTPKAKETPAPEPVVEIQPAQEGPLAVPAARISVDKAEPVKEETQGDTGAMQETEAEKPAAEKPAEPPKPVEPPKPAPARPAKKARGRRASVPTWDEIMFGARRQD
ncbi:septation protein SepH [Streptosporangium subroseum]|uniref:septation protein SepH n=1 Tax=Streptosporangium subroseum TaxID=106412 RepID=UPI003445EE2E